MGCALYVSAICLRLAERVVLVMVVERLEPSVEIMDSRWALKVRERLVGYVGCRLGSRWSLRLAFQVGGDMGEGSREARIASVKTRTFGYAPLVPEKSARKKTVLSTIETDMVLVITAPEVKK